MHSTLLSLALAAFVVVGLAYMIVRPRHARTEAMSAHEATPGAAERPAAPAAAHATHEFSLYVGDAASVLAEQLPPLRFAQLPPLVFSGAAV